MLETSELHVRFGHVHALRGATLKAGLDEIVVLIGPNGAGKSTVLNTIAGLNAPSEGILSIDGRDFGGKSPRQVVDAGVTLVPQGRRLFTSMSVRENLELGAFTRSDTAGIGRDIAEWAKFFPEVGERMGINAGALSGGQQQIVAIIRGLMSKPKMLMMDEPSIGLAPVVVKRIGEEIRRLNRQAGIGILMVEQNVEFALGVADRVIIMAMGRVVFSGAPATLRDPALLSHYFFGETPRRKAANG
ncbi:MAG: ABC transporter ATP-binding protein [Rhizobiaceae bacterium]